MFRKLDIELSFTKPFIEDSNSQIKQICQAQSKPRSQFKADLSIVKPSPDPNSNVILGMSWLNHLPIQPPDIPDMNICKAKIVFLFYETPKTFWKIVQ